MPPRTLTATTDEERRCVLARLCAARDAGSPVSALVEASAPGLGVSARTLWRWLAGGLPDVRGHSSWKAADGDVDAYVRWKGSAAAAWRERRDAGVQLPSVRTYQRAVLRALAPGDRATIRDGVPGRRRHQVYLRWEPETRNQLWEADHKQLDVPVLFPRAHRPQRPWMTLFIDGHSRALMGWAIAQQPSAATVLAALGEAVRADPDRGPFGGVPQRLRPDRGLEFAAHTLARACALLCIQLDPAPPYHPNLKGKVERLFRTIVAELLAGLPQFTGGPRDAAGRLWGASLPVLTLGELVRHVDRWTIRYNLELPHGGLGGQTPLERWCEDSTPLRLVSDDELSPVRQKRPVVVR